VYTVVILKTKFKDYELIAVLTDPAVGGTFLTWSLHYLAGHDVYFSAKNNSTVELPGNPLTKINSHNFIANQPLTIDEFTQVFDCLIHQPTDTFHTVYLHNFIHSTESADADLERSIDLIAEHAEKIVVVSNSENSNLYHAAYELRSGTAHLWSTNKVVNDPDEIFNDFVEHFFKHSADKWNALELTDPWDRREFIALNFDFNKTLHIKPNVDPNISCYNIDTMELFNTFDHGVKDLFEYLEIPIANERYLTWCDIYHTWQEQHRNRMQFVWYFDTIINGILHGEDIDLTRFQLDLVQEAAIQNHLIYNYNFNLKTWQLEKFTNTQQLHNLLESNFHDLSKQLVTTL